MYLKFVQVFKSRSHIWDSDFYYNFCDGQLYKDHPLFGVDDKSLQLILYYDDVEVVNPLGSYRGKHKLG